MQQLFEGQYGGHYNTTYIPNHRDTYVAPDRGDILPRLVTWCKFDEWMSLVAKTRGKFDEEVLVKDAGMPYTYRRRVQAITHIIEEPVTESTTERLSFDDCLEEYSNENGEKCYRLTFPDRYRNKSCVVDGDAREFIFEKKVMVGSRLVLFNQRGEIPYAFDNHKSLSYGYTTYFTGELRSLIIARVHNGRVIDFYEFVSENNHTAESERIFCKFEGCIRNALSLMLSAHGSITPLSFTHALVKHIATPHEVSASCNGSRGITWRLSEKFVDDSQFAVLCEYMKYFGLSLARMKKEDGMRIATFKKQ